MEPSPSNSFHFLAFFFLFFKIVYNGTTGNMKLGTICIPRVTDTKDSRYTNFPIIFFHFICICFYFFRAKSEIACGGENGPSSESPLERLFILQVVRSHKSCTEDFPGLSSPSIGFWGFRGPLKWS